MINNAFEFADGFLPDDRQRLIDSFVDNLNGDESEEAPVVRNVLKLSSIATEEEMIAILSRQFNMPAAVVREMNMLEMLGAAEKNFREVMALTAPYKDFLMAQKATKDKFEELTDLGRFLVACKKDYKLPVPEKPIRYPDFIVTDGSCKIGVEHTRLVDEKIKSVTETVKKVLKKAEEKLRSIDTSFNQIINVMMDYSAPVNDNGENLFTARLGRMEKEDIATRIAVYLESEITLADIERPAFIKQVLIVNGSTFPVSVELNEKYLTRSDLQERIAAAISAKEKKFENYRKEAPADTLWLLIAASDFSASSGFDAAEENFSESFSTSFDRVFLIETFSARVTELPLRKNLHHPNA